MSGPVFSGTSKFSAPPGQFIFALAAVGISTALAFAMYPFFALTNLVMVYLLGTLAVAARGHRGPAALSSVLSVLSFDFFFVPPRFTLSVSDAQYIWTFAVMFTAAMIISGLAVRLKKEAETAREGERNTAMMHAFGQELAGGRGAEKILGTAVDRIAEVFSGAVSAFLPDGRGGLSVAARSEGTPVPGEKEKGVAQWVYDAGQPAGPGTPSLPESDALFVPLRGTEGPGGVLMVEPRGKEGPLEPGRRLLLDSFAHQTGLALEMERLQESARKAEVEAETERLRSALLSSVSHDLRTPLAAILGSAGTLLEKEGLAKDRAVRELLENIEAEAERLSRLVRNLLEATRLESGAARVSKELYPLEEVVGSALERLEKASGGRKITVALPEDLPLVPMDCVLMEQVFVNLLENALRHTPAGIPIDISAGVKGGAVEVSVADGGPGLKEGDLERIFDKFYHDPASPGAGLGLAISRAVVSAHGGRIWAANRTEGGAVFRFTLPLETTHGT